MKLPLYLLMACVISLSAALFTPAHSVWAAQGVVRAVLFYSPTCPHCQKVMTQDLPPLMKKYGNQLQIMAVSVAAPAGQSFYQAAVQQFGVTEDRLGVPTLIVGKTVLVGALEIPQQFPALIEQYLAQGGIDWPAIPGLAQALAAAQSTPISPTPARTLATTPSSAAAAPALATADENARASMKDSGSAIALDNAPLNLVQKLARDPLGNGLAVAVLLGMLVVMVLSLRARLSGHTRSDRWPWLIPILAVVGMGVAAYLAFVESAHVPTLCGPVGNCNTVQQSAYARLFGWLPVGVLGLLGYALILLTWAVGHFSRGGLSERTELALFAMTFFGTLFSIYLTFLEPFVIGAICIWCLTSAIVMTALLWLTSTSPEVRA